MEINEGSIEELEKGDNFKKMKNLKRSILCILMGCMSSIVVGTETKTDNDGSRSSYETEEESSEEDYFFGIEAETQDERGVRFLEFFRKLKSEREDGKVYSVKKAMVAIFDLYQNYSSSFEGLMENFQKLESHEKNAALIVAVVIGKEFLAKEALSSLKDSSGESLQENFSEKINWCDNSVFGYSPAQFAVMANRKNFLMLFIGNGVDLNECDREGCTLLMLAIRGGDAEMVHFLLTYEKDAINLTRKDNQNRTIFDYARMKENSEICKLLENELFSRLDDANQIINTIKK